MLNEILIIEDNETTCFLHKRLFTKMRVSSKITTKQNGQEALDYLLDLKNNNLSYPEIIFVDLKMPIMDGFEFISEFKKVEKNVINQPAIVVLSTSELDRDYDNAQKLGVSLYMTKYLNTRKAQVALQVLNQ